MINFGYALLIFAAASTAVAMLGYLPGLRRSSGKADLKLARVAVYVSTLAVVGTAAWLWHLILSHQFQYSYVFRYSNLEMPLKYVFASFWGGQEGTFLLWATYGSLLALFLRFKARQYEAPVLFFYMGINLFLLLMLLKANPFATMARTPPDGNGLNPLLQDPWMTIHPPIMFFGFASLGIPAAYAMAALVKEDWDNWVRRAIPFTTFGVMALGTGLLLGGYWAYSILGWGGFWGWDPVENSSLVPWLVAVALLHNQVIQNKKGIFRRINIFLAMLPFVLLTYSTFLTRSGVLADFSVHSFTDLGINQFLVAFMVVFLGGGLGLFAFKFRRIPVDKVQAPFFSREYWIFLGSLAFGLFALFVCLGTSSPLISRLWSHPSSVQPDFYNRTGLPFAVLISVLMGASPFLFWSRSDLRGAMRKMVWPIGASVLALPALYLAGIRNPGYLAMADSALFAVLANAMVVVLVMKQNWSGAGGYLAHVGIGLALLGILTSTGFGREETVVLPKGEEVHSLGYGFKFMGVRPIENGKKDAYDVAVRTASGSYLMSPTMFFSDFNGGMMKKPAIEPFFVRDIYLSPIGYAQDQLSDRIDTPLMLMPDKPQTANGMTFTLKDIQAKPMADASQGQDVTATITVEGGGETATLSPVLKTYADGHTEMLPATVPATGAEVSLEAAGAMVSAAKIGVGRPPVILTRGETGTQGPYTITLQGFDVEQATRPGGSVKVYAHSTVSVGGQDYHVQPGLISRPGQDQLESIEAPIGRTGMNLVLADIEAQTGKAHFQVAPAPQEYLYAEASTKPFIVLLWIGTGVVLAGLALATLNRGRMAGRLAAQLAGSEKKVAALKKNGKRHAA
jgi:cytochrome c-type biogenesis protein CcmF